MHRSRPIAALTALIFLLLGAGDVFGLRACPHHEATGSHASAGVAAVDHSVHGEHGGSPAEAPVEDHAPCSCAGYCPTAANVATPAGGISEIQPTPVTEAVSVTPASGLDTPRSVPYFLPFSQAPPLQR